MGLRRLLALLIGAILLVPGLLINPMAASAGAIRAVDLLAALTVAPEQPGNYDRERFRNWIDADGDGCDTRAEVLKLESQIGVTVEGKCKVVKGRWHSWFDGVTETAASKLDIDHFVPLAEAWRSGARAWTDKQREAFANDLDYEWSLEAVTASSNRSKGDRDPADWLPPDTSAHCQYAQAWVGVKYRWRLTVDQREYNALSGLLSGTCGRASVDLPQRAIGGNAATVKPSGPGTSAPRTFSDVSRNHGFAKEIAWLGNSGISEGWVKDGKFEYRPKNLISREAMAAFMYRLAELENHPSVARFQAPARSPFKDVLTTHKFYTEITWLAAQKITTGYDDSTFKPRRQITREAMAAFMHRYADLSGRSTSPLSSSSLMLEVKSGDVVYGFW